MPRLDHQVPRDAKDPDLGQTGPDRTDSEPPDVGAEGSAGEPPRTLDGAWFRRERERIAISRRVVAAKLGVRESQIVTLEHKRLPVPAAWCAAVGSLGFRVPVAAAPAGSDATPAPEEETATGIPAGVPRVESSAPAPDPTSESPGRVVDARAMSVASPENIAALNAPAGPVTSNEKPAAVSGASASPTQAGEVPPAPSLLRGRWLRARRHALNVSLRALSIALRAPQHDVGMVESHDLMVPPGWLSILGTLQFFDASAQVRAALDAQLPYLHGGWLRTQRNSLGYSPVDLSEHLRVRPSVVVLVELRNWPLPPEWLPTLAALALPVPEPLLAAALRTASGTPPRSVSFSGAWLRRHRQQRLITQELLARYLHVEKQVVSRCERKAWPVPPEWLPILQGLGFPLAMGVGALATTPTTQQVNVPAPSPAPQARSVGSLSSLRGSWLKAQRERLNLPQAVVARQVGASQSTVCCTEQQARSIPMSWLPQLKQLGFEFPPDDALLPVPGAPNGAWLREQRVRLERSLASVAERIRVPRRMLRGAELRNEPLPAEWLLGLHRLGFPVPLQFLPASAQPPSLSLIPETVQPSQAPSTPSEFGTTSMKSHPTAPHVETTSVLVSTGTVDSARAEGAAGTAENASLDGIWLRRARERLALSRRTVAEVLGLKAHQLVHVESQRRPIPLAWHAGLTRLMFPLPRASASPSEIRMDEGRASPPGATGDSTPDAVAAAHASDTETLPAAGAKGGLGMRPISGVWLSEHRLRLKLTIPQTAYRLKVTWQAVKDAEKLDTPIPPEWLPGLRRLGFPVPPMPLPTAAQTPAPKPAPALPQPSTPQSAASVAKSTPSPKPAPAPAQPSPPPSAASTATPSPKPAPAPVQPGQPAPVATTAGSRPSPANSQRAEPPSDVAELIIEYRLKLGQRLGQPPLQVLRSILVDLQEARMEPSVSYEDVKATVGSLLRRPSKVPSAS